MSLLLASAFAARARAQAVNTYLANDGKNNSYDILNGELAPDLGGWIPFARYLETGSGGHYYATQWAAGGTGPQTFYDAMVQHATDLFLLDQDIKAHAPAAYPILPFPANVAFLEQGGVQLKTTWWSLTFNMYPYRVSGAPVLICVRSTTSGQPNPNANPQILLKNYAAHPSSFGSNQNHTSPVPGEHSQEFREPDPEAGWGAGGAVLGIEEQALANGDIVVVCQAIYSENVWFDLQATMAAEAFVRYQFIPTTLPGVTVGYSFVYGGSWGGAIALFAALLQPHIYAASAGWTGTDWTYASGDMKELDKFQYGALAMGPPSGHVVGEDFPQIFSVVDLFGMRFDGGGTSQWDLAAFSPNRRPSDLLVKVFNALQRNEDINMNGFWSLDDPTLTSNFDGRLRKFMEHGAAWGIVPGKNEYALDAGTEWATLLASNPTPAPGNVELIPTAPAPTKVWPDPYTHTLRHDATHGATVAGFLIPIDLGPAGHPNQPSSIKTLGQGVWPGYRDSMRVNDVDGDGKPEVVFGNFDGFVHDLEFGNDANDPYRLDDQYKSPYLGRGIFASAGKGQGANTRGYFADSRGRVWKMTYSGTITIDSTPLIQPDAFYVYDGEVPYIFFENFDPNSPNSEIFLLNRFLDWSLFNANTGFPLASGRAQRSNHAIQPGQATPCDTDNNGDLELLVPAADGHVWKINPASGFPPGYTPEDYISTFSSPPSAPRALFRVDVANFGSTGSPSHVLVFGRNDDLNDIVSTTSTNVMMLYTAGAAPMYVGEGAADAGDAFSEAMSFAWVVPPANGASSAEFVVSGGRIVQKYTMTTGGTFTCTGTCPVITLDPEFGAPNAITSLATVGSASPVVVVALGNGRIFALNSNLQFLRSSDRESPNLSNPTSWCSNRSLGQCFTTDLAQNSDGADADLYFADYSAPFRVENAVNKYRLGRLHLPIGPGVPSWVPYVADVYNPAFEDLYRGTNRTLLFRDIDGDGQREPHVFAETGTAFKDPATGVVREFCTYSYKAEFNYTANAYPGFTRVVKGGNVFEVFSQPPLQPVYNYLGGFNVPRDSSTPFEDFGGSDWWYPVVGPNRLSGQISSYTQSARSYNFGTSMKTAMIRPNTSTSTPVPHVVIGTNGACCYAIRPGPAGGTTNGLCTSQLGYASDCFGRFMIGMDVGHLYPGSVDDSIVVGEWIDKGTYVDWQLGHLDKNRAVLHILDPLLPPLGQVGGFTVTDLSGDDLVGLGNGLGSGITGVKIDDVNADGLPDIWCTDAIGHIWLFKQTATGLPWQTFYRSQDVGACPGVYNQIFVMKDSNHKTVRLILVSSGYVMAFTVDPSLL